MDAFYVQVFCEIFHRELFLQQECLEEHDTDSRFKGARPTRTQFCFHGTFVATVPVSVFPKAKVLEVGV